MKRLRLPAKLALAVIPIGLVALIAAGFIAYSFLNNASEQSETASAAIVTAEAIDTLEAVWDEEGLARQVHILGSGERADELALARDRTDQAIQDLRDSVGELQTVTRGFFGDVSETLSDDMRRVVDELNGMRSIATPSESELNGYDEVAEAILAVLPKTSSIVSDRFQARDLQTAYYLAEAAHVSLEQEELVEVFRDEAYPNSSAIWTSNLRTNLQSTLDVMEDEFGAWIDRADQTANDLSSTFISYEKLTPVDIDTFPMSRNEDILDTSADLVQSVTEDSQINASNSKREAYLVAGLTAIILLVALWGSYVVIRSVIRRVKGVTVAAVRVSEEDLPALVEALQNPTTDLSGIEPTIIENAGEDEVGELAESFTMLHSTLIDVAGRQMDVLRKGVSEIFVSLARRNRSLVDRQLALLDELESREEDADTLGGYYKLDHLATRMRRNAESLLVLAGSEPTRIWSSPLDVSEIIRAALGEVDDYQRVDIMALEPAMVSGRAVADVAHLMSELLDNGTQFSSPSDRVRVAGLFDPDGYMLTVSDTGIGMTAEKIAEFNDLLVNPPVLGLALQPTLGLYVAARLAARHGIRVQLISGSPGVTARVLLPKSLIEAAPPADSGVPALPAGVEYRPSTPAKPGQVRSASANGADAARKLTVVGDSAPATEESSLLPGKIKGRHEHPGRNRAVATGLSSAGAQSRPDESGPSPEVDTEAKPSTSPFAAETVADEKPGTLKKRVPGKTLGATSTPPGSDDAGSGRSDRVPGPTPAQAATAGTGPQPVDGEVETAGVGPEQRSPDGPKSDVPKSDVPKSDVPKSDVPKSDGSKSDGSKSDGSKSESPWWVEEDSDGPGREDLESPPSGPVEADTDWILAPGRDGDQENQPEQPRSKITQVGLPVRTPGVSFTENDESSTSSAASTSGAIGIKSALSEYADGRTLATQKVDDREEDDETPEGEGE